MKNKLFKKTLALLLASTFILSTSTTTLAAWQKSGSLWWNTNHSDLGYSDDWEMINGAWYYFNSTGWMQTGWIHDGKAWYYLTENGDMVGNTWINNYYLTDSGAMATNQWIDNYFVGADGLWIPNYSIKSGWKQNSVGWWYQNVDGTYPSNTWMVIDGKNYHFNSEGYMDANKWIRDSYVNDSGAMAINQWIGNYHVGADGTWDSSIGQVPEGFRYNENGMWYKFLDGTFAVNGWDYIRGSWYFFDENGYAYSNRWAGNYYLKESGEMAKNEWVENDYYVGYDGKWIPNYTNPYGISEGPIYAYGHKIKVGVDIKAGEYVMTCDHKTSSGYWYNEENGVILNSGFSSIEEPDIVVLKDGQFLFLDYACATSINIAEIGPIANGTYKVGVHIQPGTYTIESNPDSAYGGSVQVRTYDPVTGIMNDDKSRVYYLKPNDDDKKTAIVTVASGEYIYFDDAHIVK